MFSDTPTITNNNDLLNFESKKEEKKNFDLLDL